MFRYLAGLVLVQLITVGLFALNPDAEPRALALGAALPALGVAVLAASWFRTLSRADGERDLARARLEHERDRERLGRHAERERADVLAAAERSARRTERRVARRANVKVGLAFAATAGMGVLFVITELVTLGLLTMTAGGSALGGYLLRWRQSRSPGRVVGSAAEPFAEPFTDRPVDSLADPATDSPADRAALSPRRARDALATKGASDRLESTEEIIALPAPERPRVAPAGDPNPGTRRRRSAPGRARA